jgi:hypothetical protein
MKAMPRSRTSTRVLERFNHLMKELLEGKLDRNSFQPWESEIILDILICDVQGPSMNQLLRRYQKSVQRQLARGSHSPMRFSEYLESKHSGSRGRAA